MEEGEDENVENVEMRVEVEVEVEKGEKEVEVTTTTQGSSSSQDKDQRSDDPIVPGSHHCTNSREWTEEDISILLNHCLDKRINTKKLYESGLHKQKQAMSKQWRSMKRQIRKLFKV